MSIASGSGAGGGATPTVTVPSRSVAAGGGDAVVLGLGAKQLAVAGVVGAAALMVVVGAVAGVDPLGLVDDGGADLALVPAGADTVSYVDVDQATSDPAIREVVDTWLEVEPGSPDTMAGALARFENETGLDPNALHHATAFSRYEESTGEGASDYSATILRSDWAESDVVDAIESRDEVTLERRTYNGVAIYAPRGDDGTPEAASDSWLAVLGDGTYVLGTERAVRDVVDVHQGDAETLDGKLKNAFQNTRDGYLRFAVNVPEERVPSGESASVDTSKYRDVEMLSGSYYTATGKLGLEMTMHATDESAADDIADVTDGALSLLAGTSENEELKQTLRAVEVEQDGDDVSITYENSVDEVQELVRALEEQSEETDEGEAAIEASPSLVAKAVAP
jgi:hypothetical protein